MSYRDRASRILSLVTLQRTRGLLASRGSRAMAGFIAVAYGFIAMLVGQMLVLARNDGPHYSVILWSSGNGTGAWNYPALLVSAGWGSLALPFFPTIAMVVVAIGVGLGMSVSVLLAIRLLRQPRRTPASPTAFGSVVGLTPAMIGLLTLGACCSTTAAATAGLGAIAQANGTTIDELLASNWFVGVFQIAVLWVALVAQEQLIAIYGVLFGVEKDAAPPRAPRPDATVRPIIRLVVRAALLIVGMVSALSILVDWMVTPASTPAPADWVVRAVQAEVPALAAVFAALFPIDALAILTIPRSRGGTVARLVLFGGGVSLLTWFPPMLVEGGVHGLGNELLSGAGLPTAWGAVSPSVHGAGGLLFRWIGEYALLGGFAIVAALAPHRVLRGLGDPVHERPGLIPEGPSIPSGPDSGREQPWPPTVRAGRAPLQPGSIVSPTGDGER